MTQSDREFVRDLVKRNRYLVLATAGGGDPWIAPVEYVSDDELNLYFLSPESAVHSRHIDGRESVAVAIFDAVQPEYEPAPVMRIAGVQLTATARKLEAPFPALVDRQIEAWKLPIPPYAVYKIKPDRWFIPVIKDGVNDRVDVSMN